MASGFDARQPNYISAHHCNSTHACKCVLMLELVAGAGSLKSEACVLCSWFSFFLFLFCCTLNPIQHHDDACDRMLSSSHDSLATVCCTRPVKLTTPFPPHPHPSPVWHYTPLHCTPCNYEAHPGVRPRAVNDVWCVM